MDVEEHGMDDEGREEERGGERMIGLEEEDEDNVVVDENFMLGSSIVGEAI